MPINTSEVLSLVAQVCEEEQLRVATTESFMGGVLAGGTAMIGGLLFGPIGLALGGAIGGMTAAHLSQGKFKSVASVIINDLTPGQKQRLANSVRMRLQNRSVGDLAKGSLKALLLQIAIQFFIAALGSIFLEKHEQRKSVKRLENSPSYSRV